jgi:cobalt-zinc-cadmium efflux system outer membrane protein
MLISVRRLIVAAICLGLLTSAFASAQDLTEAEAVRRFELENARLRAIAAQTREVRAETRSWSLLSNPEATFSREDAAGTRDTFFYVGQSVPLSGRLGFLRRAGASAARAAEAGGRFESFALLSELKAAFYGLLLAQERTALIDAWLVPFKDIVRVLREREAAQDVSRFDRLRAERELADAEAEAASVRVDVIRARAKLASFFGPGGPVTPLAVQGSFSAAGVLPPLEAVTAQSLAVRGDLLAAGLVAERFDYEAKAAGRRIIPEPVLAAGFKRTEIPGLSDSGLLLTLSLSLPLFNSGKAESAKAKAAAERSREEMAAVRRDIETEVAAAHETVRLRRRLAEDYVRELGEKGGELSRIGRLAYDEGERGILELLDSNRLALASRLQAVGLAWAAKQAEIDLNRIVGEEVVK